MLYRGIRLYQGHVDGWMFVVDDVLSSNKGHLDDRGLYTFGEMQSLNEKVYITSKFHSEIGFSIIEKGNPARAPFVD